MLERLTISDFQCHESFELELDPHTTFLVGESDVGKSALLRSLRWLCLNTPSGDAFIRDGSPFAKVELTLDDGRTITRQKGKGGNSYTIDDGEALVSFGTGKVPEPISALLNVGEENFATQDAAHFWFSETPGEVSRSLNEIVNLSLIDSTLANVASELRKCRAEEDLIDKRYKEARTRRDSLAWTEEASVKLEKIDKLEESLSNLRKQALELRRLLSEGDRLTRTVERCQRANLGARKAIAVGEKALESAQRGDKLRSLLAEWDRLSAVRGPSAEQVNRLAKKMTALAESSNKAERLRELLDRSTRLEEQEKRLRQKAESAETALHELVGDKCPLCGRSDED